MPQPILITADSGEGKTRTAHLAAGRIREATPWWLRQVRTNHPRGVPVETINCNGLVGRNQDAKIAVFGRGVQDPGRERPDASGLVVLGKTQLASGGILIFDELGNSDLTFQEMLLTFVETGRTQPEFLSNQMNVESLGPLDVLCIFTAQPTHIESGRIKADLERRYARGTTVAIPRLTDRPEDIVPIFYESLAACLRTQDPRWIEPESVDEVVLPEAQEWLRGQVPANGLSASLLTDLVGSAPLRVIGVPYLEYRLSQVAKTRQRAVSTEPRPAEPAAPCDGFELVRQLTEGVLPQFPATDSRLRGLLAKVHEAAGQLLLSYLDSCLDRAGGGRNDINVIGTCKLVNNLADDAPVKSNQARDVLKEALLVSPSRTAAEIRRSERLARLAIDIAKGNRSQPVRGLLESVGADPEGRAWLQSLGWEASGPSSTPALTRDPARGTG